MVWRLAVEHVTEYSYAGDVFAFEPGITGLREPRFAGDPDAVRRR